jgi:hypothetical protein
MIDYATNAGWSTPAHKGKIEELTKDEAALNKTGVLESLAAAHKIKKCFGFRTDPSNGLLVEAILDPAKTDVVMVKGVHQAKFGAANPLDQVRVDQTHYQVRWAGAAHHIYVQPNLSAKWEITEMT